MTAERAPDVPRVDRLSLDGLSRDAEAALFRVLATDASLQIACFDGQELRCRFASRALADALGRDPASLIGLRFDEIVGADAGTDAGADAGADAASSLDRLRTERGPVVHEQTGQGLDGGKRWAELRWLPLPGAPAANTAAGPLDAVLLLRTDITAQRLAERAVHDAEDRLGKFMQASAEGIVFHRDGFITDANPPLCTLIGYSLDELRGRRTLEFVAPEEVAKAAAVFAADAETSYESVLVDRRGNRVPVELVVRTMLRHGEGVRMAVVRDLRDHHAALARIHQLAHHDALTGLPNRTAFVARLQHLIDGSRRADTHLGVLSIDLDHFKRVNDSIGPMAGDILLRTVAARITASLRTTDIVARFGGDEFMVLLGGPVADREPLANVERVAQKLLVSIGEPLDADGQVISVTPSIGIARFPEDGTTPDELLKHADSAMALAKARGRANVQFFEPAQASSALAALVMESELAQALARGEFELHFQPQVRADDGRLQGAEALIRWRHPVRGLLGADAFIRLAEERQLMLPIGQWVLREAARCAMRWRGLGLAVGPVAVNLTNIQFQSIGFVEAVADVLPDAGIGPDGGTGLIELELTERMLMDDLSQVLPRLERLKAMGLEISIDDFGTGYSSLAHLMSLPIDKLKIDRSFVCDLPANTRAAAIVRAVIAMAQSLGMAVVAEGIETEAQRAFLAAQGCDLLQGLLFGAPMPQPAFEAWVRARRGDAG